MKNALRWLALCTALVSTGAWADHPLVTDTADSLPRGTCQIELGRSQEKARATPTANASDVQFSCGSGAQSQLAIGLSSSRAEGLRTENYRAVGKTTFVAPEDGRTGVGLRYGLGWAREPGQGAKLESMTLLAAASREVSNGVLVHANLGVTRDRIQAKSTGLWSVGVETSGTLGVAADIFGEERSKPSVSVGARWQPSKDSHVSAAYAVQTAGAKAKTLSLSLKMVF